MNQRLCGPCKTQDNRVRAARQRAHRRDQRWWRDNVRPRVLARDNHRCVRCGSSEDLTVDFIPAGVHTRNLGDYQTLCRPCHTLKTVEQREAKRRAG